ncbi:hypothetical protein EXU57_17405 [Segetibacter sp. 3557_3]|uniref:hypothetical protein n=1 Tax=Segetibacter sp. 3557_3 TaxID=2547429 RepID=UPI001058778F|nr:hypothetical protein [Segetibacter sp. 3557_3]TDH23251.1 hypothetical protein EXU57_17405 [Segetibacter sp. 3557_3]
MKQPLLLLFFTCFTFTLFAQQGDFIVIKKRGRTVKSFFSGAEVSFQMNNGEWFQGKIANIKNDSLFFRQQIVRQVPTPWGVPRLDTMTTGVRRVYFKDIRAIPKKHESFSYVKDGTVFIMAGAGYLLLNVINSAYLHYAVFGDDNLPKVLGATGVLATGLALKKLHKDYIVLGRKYAIDYIKM